MGVLVEKGDRIVFISLSSQAVRLRGRFRVRYEHGRLENVDFQVGADTPTDRTVRYWVSNWAASGDGELVSGNVVPFQAAATLRRGSLYVAAYVFSELSPLPGGSTTDPGGSSHGLICKGYVYDLGDLAVGDFVEPGPGGGEGNIRTITGSNPAAGAEVSEAVPTNAVGRLLSFSAVFVADANAANRVPALWADDGTTANRRALIGKLSAAITASLTRTCLWQEEPATLGGASAQLASTDTDSIIVDHSLRRGGLLLPGGYRIRTVTDAILAGDNYAAPIFQVEEWLVL